MGRGLVRLSERNSVKGRCRPRMRNVQPSDNWPSSWKQSYSHDCLEVYGDKSNPGYTLAYKQRLGETLKLLMRAIPAGGRVLDVAAAQGNFSLMLAEAGYRMTWNDIRPELVEYVKLKHQTGIIEFCPGNILDMQFDQPFDAVLITEVIEHTAHPDQFLKHIATLIKPSGHIVISTPNGNYFRNSLPRFSECADPSIYEELQFRPDSDGHIFLLYEEELREFAASANLTLVDLRYVSNCLISGHVKFRYVLPFLPEGVVLASQQLLRLIPAFERKLSAGMVALLQG